MKRLGVVGALALAGGAFWYLQRSRTPAIAADAPPPPAMGTAVAGSAHAAEAAKRFDKVTKLANADERKQLADRIASAQAARAASRSAPIPRLPDGSAEEETAISKTEIRSAMRELVPYITACYEEAIPKLGDAPDISVLAELTLIGAPDVGTIVDAHGLADRDGNSLVQSFDDCLRNTFQLMALPPLAEGDKIEVRYPFEFRTK